MSESGAYETTVYGVPGEFSVLHVGQRTVMRPMEVNEFVWLCERTDCGWTGGQGYETAEAALHGHDRHRREHHPSPSAPLIGGEAPFEEGWLDDHIAQVQRDLGALPPDLRPRLTGERGVRMIEWSTDD